LAAGEYCCRQVVTKDGLLHDTAKLRLPKGPSFRVFASLEELLNHLKLAHEAKTKAFTEALLKNAAGEFFTADNPNCVYNRYKIRDEIFRVGALSFAESELFYSMNIALPITPNWMLSSITPPPQRRWQSLSEDKFWIKNPSYLKMEGQGIYSWRSDITAARLYREVDDSKTITFGPRDYIRIAPFSVFWKCKADADAVITESALEKVTAGAVKAEVATEALRREYGLPSEIDLLLQSLVSKQATGGLPSLSGNPPVA
jgi:hypothetical protein